ncbi:hypothetical protein PHMEG_00038751 [Phytophthora megakarya]|uniref:Eukaryotic/viral aspartic protease n=1 Tax=Phytophthora megakarya TaxID=4795 RepID=A0A225UI84_9STRA|nr:hypothetical protein PHMEG_00038751 [Phytophthora megakarya]
MMRVPGSSGASGFHRESQEGVQVKPEQGNEMSSDARSTTPSLNARSADRQSARENSVDGTDTIYAQGHASLEFGNPRSKTVRKKMKAPDDEEDEDHLGSGWSEEDLKSTYHRKELRDFVDQDPGMRILKLKRFTDPKKTVTAPATLNNKLDTTMELIRLVREAGMIPGSFNADTLFDLDLDVIQVTSCDLFQKLKILVGEAPQSPDPLPLTTADTVDNLTVSSHYASAAEDGSDTSSEPPRRMSLGPSGASMLEARSKIPL